MKTFIAFTVVSTVCSLALAQTIPGSYREMAQAEIQKPAVAQVQVPDKAADVNKKVTDNQNSGSIKMAKVFFVSPKNGETVPKKFKVKMGVEGIKIRPAGEAPEEMTSGHHHLIIDGTFVEAGVPIAENAKSLHFGKGQTEVEVTLPAGEHTLTLQFADGAHRSFGEKMSATIKVTVK